MQFKKYLALLAAAFIGILTCGLVQAQPFLTNGLVAYFPFNGNANDLSGMGIPTSVIGNPFFAADRFSANGSSVSFSALADMSVATTSAVLPAGAGPFSVGFWFKPTYRNMVDQTWGYSYTLLSFPRHPSTAWNNDIKFEIIRSYGGETAFVISGPPNWRMGTNYFGFALSEFKQWHHFLLSYSGSHGSVYLDGALVLESYMDFPLTGGPIVIGKDSTGPQQPYDGLLDDLRVYNRGLSYQEVKDLHAFEAMLAPTLSVLVQSVRVTMHVIPTKRYQLQASVNLATWSNVGTPFVASSSEIVQELDATQVGRCFRLQQLP